MGASVQDEGSLPDHWRSSHAANQLQKTIHIYIQNIFIYVFISLILPPCARWTLQTSFGTEMARHVSQLSV